MYEKNGRFFADWLDHAGKRHRKSFRAEIDARRYEHAQQARTLAAELGRQAKLSTHHMRRKGAAAVLLRECAQIALTTALDKRPAAGMRLTDEEIQQAAQRHHAKRRA